MIKLDMENYNVTLTWKSESPVAKIVKSSMDAV